MSDSKLYSEGSRRLQDRFDMRRIADRLEKVDLLAEFTDVHRAIIEAAPMFFLATADAQGETRCFLQRRVARLCPGHWAFDIGVPRL